MKKTSKTSPQKKKYRKTLRIAILVCIGALALTVLGIRLFDSVDMSSGDLDEEGSTKTTTGQTKATATTTTESPQTTSPQTTSSPQTTTTTKPKTTTTKAPVNNSGHYVQPAGADWNLKLVNKWNTLDKNYAQQLVTYAGVNKFDSRAIDSLKALVAAGKSYNIRVASLYRTYEKQTDLFERQVASVMAKGYNREKAEEMASTEVARPGTSEHNLGLSVDFLFETYSNLTTDYEKTQAYTWMMEHCADYGFILRYPKNKTSVTGVSFEPWHYRYVGPEAAKEIMQRGITLEEYLEMYGK